MKESLPATISPEKQELLTLEKSGKFVFHGTAEEVESLEPRQAIDTKKGLDRKPAVFASVAADYAIFRAILHDRNLPSGASFVFATGATAHKDGSFTLKFKAPKAALDALPDSTFGYVYVFDKKSFNQIPGRRVECESNVPVKPIKKIKVLKRDLPSNIIFE